MKSCKSVLVHALNHCHHSHRTALKNNMATDTRESKRKFKTKIRGWLRTSGVARVSGARGQGQRWCNPPRTSVYYYYYYYYYSNA